MDKQVEELNGVKGVKGVKGLKGLKGLKELKGLKGDDSHIDLLDRDNFNFLWTPHFESSKHH